MVVSSRLSRVWRNQFACTSESSDYEGKPVMQEVGGRGRGQGWCAKRPDDRTTKTMMESGETQEVLNLSSCVSRITRHSRGSQGLECSRIEHFASAERRIQIQEYESRDQSPSPESRTWVESRERRKLNVTPATCLGSESQRD